MHITEATENQRESWNTFVKASATGSFLQSWEWGEFQRIAGFRILRLMVRAGFTDRDIWATCLLVYRSLPLKRRYLAASWGPVLRVPGVGMQGTNEDTAKVFSGLSEALKARLVGPTIFAHIEPRLTATKESLKSISSCGFKVGTRSIHPKDRFDLTDAKSTQ